MNSGNYRFSPRNRSGNNYIYTQKGTYDCPPGSVVITGACRRLDKFEQEKARTGEYVPPRTGHAVGRRATMAGRRNGTMNRGRRMMNGTGRRMNGGRRMTGGRTMMNGGRRMNSRMSY